MIPVMQQTSAPFAALPPRARTALLAITRQVSFPSGATVVREGARGDSFFAVLAGQVKMCRLTPGGKNLILSLFGPGELFAVTTALSGDACTTTFETVIASECLEIRRTDLFALLGREPDLLADVLSYLTRRLADCTNCLVETSCARGETRFASLFLGLADKIGETADGGALIPLPLSRQELADLTGTTLETAIRVMSRWGKAGVVTTRRDGFLLHDRADLERLTWE